MERALYDTHKALFMKELLSQDTQGFLRTLFLMGTTHRLMIHANNDLHVQRRLAGGMAHDTLTHLNR